LHSARIRSERQLPHSTQGLRGTPIGPSITVSLELDRNRFGVGIARLRLGFFPQPDVGREVKVDLPADYGLDAE